MIKLIKNRDFGVMRSKPKIFCIGFNKSGTTSLHHLFRRNGLRSVHYLFADGRALAIEAEKCNTPKQCLHLFSQGQVFSDFTYATDTSFHEPIDRYPLWKEAYPDAYFLLNDRNVDAWVASRRKHRNGTFMERQMSFHGLPAKGVESLWRAQYADHKRKVLNFFGSDRRFCHFVLERDNASKIASFVSPDYDLYPARFEHINRSKSD